MCATWTQGFSALGDDILRDRNFRGVLSEGARHKLLATKDVALKVCVDLCRAEEAADHTGCCLPGASQAHNGSFVNAVKPIDLPEAQTSWGGGGGGRGRRRSALCLPQPKAPDSAAKAPPLSPARRRAQTVVVRHTARTHVQLWIHKCSV